MKWLHGKKEKKLCYSVVTRHPASASEISRHVKLSAHDCSKALAQVRLTAGVGTGGVADIQFRGFAAAETGKWKRPLTISHFHSKTVNQGLVRMIIRTVSKTDRGTTCHQLTHVHAGRNGILPSHSTLMCTQHLVAATSYAVQVQAASCPRCACRCHMWMNLSYLISSHPAS